MKVWRQQHFPASCLRLNAVILTYCAFIRQMLSADRISPLPEISAYAQSKHGQYRSQYLLHWEPAPACHRGWKSYVCSPGISRTQCK